jgi:hypothetical protein
MSAAIDYPRLAADLLSAEASDVEIRVTLAVAALHGQELSVRDIARAAKISLPGAQTGIRRAVANNRLRQTQVRTNAQAKSEQLPRCRYEVAEGYLCNFVTQGPITLDESQEARNPLSEPMQQNYIGGQSDPDLCNDVAQAMQDSDIGSADSESVDTRENGTLISELSKPPLTPFEEGADAPTPPEDARNSRWDLPRADEPPPPERDSPDVGIRAGQARRRPDARRGGVLASGRLQPDEPQGPNRLDA